MSANSTELTLVIRMCGSAMRAASQLPEGEPIVDDAPAPYVKRAAS